MLVRFCRLYIFLAFLFFAFSVSAQKSLYMLSGFITDQGGQPLAGVTVYLHETLQGTLSNDSGYYFLEKINPGNYHVHITFPGFVSQTKDVSIKNSGIRADFQLRESNLELNEVIIESSMLKLDRNESSQSIQVVGQDFLRKNQGTNLMNSLELLPGINSIQMGVGVSKPVIRGMSGNRVVVAENGIKQEGQQWGGDHGLEIDQYNAERIEIIKGPGSLIYGSDAMAGVIQIKQPVLPVAGTHGGEVSGIYKSVNNTWGSTAMVKGNHKGWVYRLRATLMDYADYKVPASSFVYNRYVLPIYEKKLKNTAGNEKHFSAQAGVHRKWGFSRFTVSNYHQEVGLFSGATGIPREYNLLPDGNNRNIALPSQSINHLKLISNSNFLFGRTWLEVDLAYQNNRRTESSLPHAHGQSLLQSSSVAHRLELQTGSVSMRLHIGQENAFSNIAGLSFQMQQNNFSGFEFLLPRFHTLQGGLFAIQKWKINRRAVLNSGLRLDLGKTDIDRHEQPLWRQYQIIGYEERVPAISRQYVSWSGMAGLSYYLSSRWNFKINAGKSFRFPTPQELSVNGVHHGAYRYEQGNAALQPESGYQFDFSFLYETGGFRFHATPFLNYFSNYIYLSPTARFSPLPEAGQIYAYRQAAALHGGGELHAELHPLPQLHLEAGLEYIYALNYTSGLPLPFTPPLMAKLNAEYSFREQAFSCKDIYIRLGWIAASAQNKTDRNERATPAYHAFSFGTGAKYVYRRREIFHLYFYVRNMGNAGYLNHLSRWRQLNIPEPGRNINIQLTVPF
jgi:iron complex outermembrane receptor protein